MTVTKNYLGPQDLYIDLSNKKAMWHFFNLGVPMSIVLKSSVVYYTYWDDKPVYKDQLVVKVDLGMGKKAFHRYLKANNLLLSQQDVATPDAIVGTKF